MDNNFIFEIGAKLNDSEVRSQLNNLIKKQTIEIAAKLAIDNLEAEKKVSQISKSVKSNLEKKYQIKVDDSQIKSVVRESQKLSQTMAQQMNSVGTKSIELQRMAEYYRQMEVEAKKVAQAQDLIASKKYDANIAVLEAGFRKAGLSAEDTKAKVAEVSTAYEQLKSKTSDPEAFSKGLENLDKKLITVQNELKKFKAESSTMTKEVSALDRVNFSNKMKAWLKSNSAAAGEFGAQIEQLIQECKTCDGVRFGGIKKEFASLTSQAQIAGKTGKSFTDTLKAGVQKFSEWGVASGIVMSGVSKIRQSISELKEINTILTEISKTSDLTTSQIKNLGSSSFGVASKYGESASNYLFGIQEMYRSGYTDAEQLAELSVLAQSAGDLDAELANDYIIASDAAYGYAGNVEKLNALLDSQNQVTNRNAVSMEELARATKVAANQLSNSNIAENEMTALLGTGIASSREAGETVGRAVKGIIMNLQQVEGETGFDGEVIDEEQLAKVEARCHSVGVELEYMQDGMAKLRNPMEVLKELADVYNSLPDDSADKAGIISDIGGKVYHVIQKCITRIYLIAGNALEPCTTI